MAGLVKELITREEALLYVSERLQMPWEVPMEDLHLANVNSRILARPVFSPTCHPPFSRSLRDGFAVRSSDTKGSTQTSPAFLEVSGEIPMGMSPDLVIQPLQAAVIHTGGMIPEGADAVVMIEDSSLAGRWVEIKRSVQSGENIILEGEEIRKGQMLLPKGALLDFRCTGILAHSGIASVPVVSLKVGVISTGDEVADIDQRSLAPGCVRDVNSWMIQNLLSSRGFSCKNYGIVQDDKDQLRTTLQKAYDENQVVILSGGSSVSVRDHCSELFEEIPSPGLMVRGVRIKPGKPTLIAGCSRDSKIVFGLPGHPLSCMVVTLNVVLPILKRMISEDIHREKIFTFPSAGDIFGRTGIEEFIPCRIEAQGVVPLMAKSGYIAALQGADGFIRLSENQETLRKSEMVEVILW